MEVGTETLPVKATVITGGEHDEIFAKQASLYPVFAEYQKRTSRKIPVIALVRSR